MPNYSIALSGLDVAQRALEMVSTNISNAATQGYHRQRLKIVSLSGGGAMGDSMGGARVAGAMRQMDGLLDGELLRQQPSYAQIAQELQTFQTIESSIGGLDDSGLFQAMSDFFSSLSALAAEPQSQAMQEQVVARAEGLAWQFRNLGQFLQQLRGQIQLDAQNTLRDANNLIDEIGELNRQILTLSIRGQMPNLLMDRRDQAVQELGALVDVQVSPSPGQEGVVNVTCYGTPVGVLGEATHFASAITADGKLGITVEGDNLYQTEVDGGRFGALIRLHNQLLPAIQDQLDLLASQMITQLNRQHVQGVGTTGGFTRLSGQAVSAEPFAQWAPGFGDQPTSLFVRVTRLSDGAVARHEVAVLPTDTVADLAARLEALPGLSASAEGGRLDIRAEGGYQFDFLPDLLQSPDVPLATAGSAQPMFGGQYTGQASADYDFVVVQGGTVGATAGLAIEVRDQAGHVLGTLNVGAGYAAGDTLVAANGISVSLSAGTLAAGDRFTVQALADSDPSGVLAALGINVLFEGNSALTVRVAQRVLDDSRLLATARNRDMNDNGAIKRMAALSQEPLAALKGMSLPDALRTLITHVGQEIAVRQSRQASAEQVIQQLTTQRDELSGVDINEQAAQMLVFERMFQAMAKVITAQSKSMDALLELL